MTGHPSSETNTTFFNTLDYLFSSKSSMFSSHHRPTVSDLLGTWLRHHTFDKLRTQKVGTEVEVQESGLLVYL